MKSVAAATLALCVLASVCPPGLQAQASTLESLFRQGTEALRDGNLDLAAQDFSAAAKMNPSFAEASFNLGLVRTQQGQYEQAIASLEHSLALKPRLRGAHLFLGIAHYRRNEYDKAIPALKRETEI